MLHFCFLRASFMIFPFPYGSCSLSKSRNVPSRGPYPSAKLSLVPWCAGLQAGLACKQGAPVEQDTKGLAKPCCAFGAGRGCRALLFLPVLFAPGRSFWGEASPPGSSSARGDDVHGAAALGPAVHVLVKPTHQGSG